MAAAVKCDGCKKEFRTMMNPKGKFPVTIVDEESGNKENWTVCVSCLNKIKRAARATAAANQ